MQNTNGFYKTHIRQIYEAQIILTLYKQEILLLPVKKNNRHEKFIEHALFPLIPSSKILGTLIGNA